MIWYSALLLLNIAAALRIALHIWEQSDMRGRAPALVALAAIALWSASVLAQILIPLPPVLYAGTMLASLTRTIFSTMLLYALLAYSGAGRGSYGRLFNSLLQGMAVVMLAVLVFELISNPFLHLWAAGFRIVSAGDLTLMLVTPGSGRLFFERAGYVVAVMGCLYALSSLQQAVKTQRRAVRPIMISVAATVAMLLGLRLIYGDLIFAAAYYLDIAIIAFGVITLARSIRDHKPFAIIPVGRRVAIDQLEVGVLVFDTRGSLIDANPAAARMVSRPIAELDQLPASAIHPVIGTVLSDRRNRPIDLVIGEGAGQRIYEVQRSEIHQGDAPLGALLRLHDVTENRRLLHELRRLATEDGLTGAINRRHFFELAQEELARPGEQPVALLLFDADYFKAVNDSYGHHTGDLVLIALVARVRAALRTEDLLGRYGGEEFVVLARWTGRAAAAQLAERLRVAVGQTPIVTPTDTIPLTISIGVTVWEKPGQPDLSALLHEADCALYIAKDRGRDQVQLAWEVDAESLCATLRR